MRKEKDIGSWLLIALATLLLLILLVLPLVLVAHEALARGIRVYLAAISDPFAIKALSLTLMATVIAVALNTLFGLASAWLLTKYDFHGKALIGALIDLPFAISPVVAGLFFVVLFGRMSPLFPLLREAHVQVLFAVPAVVLATVFVTFPFITRELVPVMESQGRSEEEAAATLGASGWQTFWHVTLPNIRWALLYGVILAAARAMGEFGAVSVVSGHIRGRTNTLPLHIEILYNEYNFTAAFAVASLLVVMAVVLLAARNAVEWRAKRGMHHGD